MPTLFIDGEAGTTGLEISKRLENRTDIQIIRITPEKRKDATERKRLLNECDLSILCLPDDASREAAQMVTNPRAKLIDASTAFRVDDSWIYGFPELTAGQGDLIRNATRVSNPGCFPTGALALLRPLVDAGILSPTHDITINAISGYSGGGKELITLCENAKDDPRSAAYCLYGLDQKHKHIPEIRKHSGLAEDPIFIPSYSGAFYRGMLVQIALKNINGETAHKALTQHYAETKYIKVEPLQIDLEKGFILSPTAQNETNNLQLRVFWNPEKQTTLLTACLDNLGKGASGAAVQNMDLMLGL